MFHDPNFNPLTSDLYVMMHTFGQSFDKNILILEQPYLCTVGDWFWLPVMVTVSHTPLRQRKCMKTVYKSKSWKELE